jgi:hypothetical protein
MRLPGPRLEARQDLQLERSFAIAWIVREADLDAQRKRCRTESSGKLSNGNKRIFVFESPVCDWYCGSASWFAVYQ